MEKSIDRREVLKTLAYFGAGLYLPACIGSSDSSKDQANSKVDSSSHVLDSSVSEPQDTVETVQKLPWDSDNLEIFERDNDRYNELKNGFNLRVQKSPKAIAVCFNSEGVSAAIKYALHFNLPVAIMSGGHSFEGFSSNENGLVINLRSMNKIKTLENDYVEIEPGCTLSELYDQLLPKQLLIPAGSCGGVGIGGLTLGGGYGFFSRKYGLTCDRLEEVEMVDANGEIVNSSTDKNLLWACKGGGNGNFGIITKFKFKAVQAPSFFQSFRFKAYKLTTERAKLLLEKFFELTPSLPNHCFGAFVLNQRTLTLLITTYEKANEELMALLKQFEKVCDKASYGAEKNLSTALKTYYGVQHPIYFKNASAGLYKNYDDISGCIDQVIDIVRNNRQLIYQVNTLGGEINSDKFKDNSSYPHRESNYLAELQAYWDAEPAGQKLQSAFQSIQDLFYQNGVTKHYRNYPDINIKNWKEAYYGSNYTMLQYVKSKYDPKGFFDYEQGIKLN